MPAEDSPQVIERGALDELLDALRSRGFTPIGPTVRQGAIVYDELDSAADLPAGWTDVQDGGTYRLERRDDDAVFGHNVGPELVEDATCSRRRSSCGRRGAPRTAASRSRRSPPSGRATRSSACARATCTPSRCRTAPSSRARGPTATTRRAARAPSSSPSTAARPAATCFCVSMGTGPRAELGLRPRAHRAARRRPGTASWSRWAASAARRCWRELPAARRRGRRRGGRRAGRASAPRRRWAARSTPPTSGTCSTATASIRAGTRWPTAASPAATARWSARPASAAASTT